MFFEINNLIFTLKIFGLVQVSLTDKNEHSTNAKDIGREIMDKVRETFHDELDGVRFAYDGDKILITIRSLPKEEYQLNGVALEDASSNKYKCTLYCLKFARYF